MSTIYVRETAGCSVTINTTLHVLYMTNTVLAKFKMTNKSNKNKVLSNKRSNVWERTSDRRLWGGGAINRGGGLN